jgi:hypothetical protein
MYATSFYDITQFQTLEEISVLGSLYTLFSVILGFGSRPSCLLQASAPPLEPLHQTFEVSPTIGLEPKLF